MSINTLVWLNTFKRQTQALLVNSLNHAHIVSYMC